jgi:hypothetical protein
MKPTSDGDGHIDALSTTLAAFGRHARYASEQATELQDADTADIFTEVARGIDTWLWFVQTSQQASRQLSREERCSAEAERSDTDGSFNAFGNAPAISLRAEGMRRRGVLRKARVRWTVAGSQRRSAGKYIGLVT